MSSICRSPELANAIDTTGAVFLPRYSLSACVKDRSTNQGPIPSAEPLPMAA